MVLSAPTSFRCPCEHSVVSPPFCWRADDGLSPWHVFPRNYDFDWVHLEDDRHATIKVKEGRLLTSYRTPTRRARIYACIKDLLPADISFDLYEAYIDAFYRYSHCMGGAVRKLLPPGQGGLFIDAGAYIGFKAIGFADYMGPDGQVLMIEIDQTNEALARRNISQNGLDNQIRSVCCAIWKHDGEITARSRGYSAHTLVETADHKDWHGKSTVSAKCLDTIFAEAGLDEITYLNLQLNGAEVEALEGLSQYFDRVQVIRSAGQFTRDGLLGKHSVADHLEARGCYVERRKNTVLAITPRFRSKYGK